MLPRSLRLTRKGFENALGVSRIRTPHFTISYKNNTQLGGSAVIVPKKAVKKAASRHQLKRKVREALRPWSSPSRILIVSARTGADSLSSEEIKRELSAELEAILAR
jgi:ribonuclease P protein component